MWIQKNDALDIDFTLDGGVFKLNLDRFNTILFGGLVDSPQNNYYYNYKNTVYGLSLGVQLIENLHIDLQGLRISEDKDIDYPYNYNIGGGIININLFDGKLEFYNELNVMSQIDAQNENNKTNGKAFYSSLNFSVGPFIILAEYKDYDKWTNPYTNPPSLDRIDEPNEWEDVKGPRLKVDFNIDKWDMNVFASYGQFRKHETDYDIYRIYGGVEKFHDKFYLNIIYGVSIDKNQNISTLQTNRLDAEFDIYLTSLYSLTFFNEIKREINEVKTENFTNKTYTDYNKGYVSFNRSKKFSITLHYAWDYNWHNKYEDYLLGGEVEFQATDYLVFKIFYGQLPGGFICSGGVCRRLPDFEGFKFETTLQF